MAKSDPFVKKSQKSNFRHNHIKKVIDSRGKPRSLFSDFSSWVQNHGQAQ